MPNESSSQTTSFDVPAAALAAALDQMAQKYAQALAESLVYQQIIIDQGKRIADIIAQTTETPA